MDNLELKLSLSEESVLYLVGFVTVRCLTAVIKSNVDSLYSTYLVSQFMMSYDDSTYLVNEIMTYDI